MANPLPGTDFPDSIKLEARRLAFFRCCYCHDKPGDQVHHLTPKEEGGGGTLANAILLCVQCHMDYGHRADKRLQLRQARDHWYEIVAKRYVADALAQAEKLDSLKSNVDGLRIEVTGMLELLRDRIQVRSTTADEIVSIGSSMVNSIVANPVAGSMGLTGFVPNALVAARCKRCGSEERANAAFCSMCGNPLR